MTYIPEAVFYDGAYIVVSAFHSFGSATVKGSGVRVSTIRDRANTGETLKTIDADYTLTAGTALAVMDEYDKAAGRIRRAERRARDWAGGYHYAQKEDAMSNEAP